MSCVRAECLGRDGCGLLCFRIDKKTSYTKSKDVRSKTPAEESSSRLLRQVGAEGATAPETLRPRDRSGMTLWKAAFL
jgi:hypothetical protein